ncbi:MAG: hypothetical protein FWH26_01785 [Oscillospiraceae bacterium]|nr:hypothetical protein [Oscillospiraceae bacterium]
MKTFYRSAFFVLTGLLLVSVFSACKNIPDKQLLTSTSAVTTEYVPSAAADSTHINEDTSTGGTFSSTETKTYTTSKATTSRSTTVKKTTQTTEKATKTEKATYATANFKDGELSSEELQVFFKKNQVFFEAFVHEFEVNFRELIKNDYGMTFSVYLQNGEVTIRNYGTAIQESSEKSLKELAKPYLEAVGTNNYPSIGLTSWVDGDTAIHYPLINFEFLLPDGAIIILYSPEHNGANINEGWEHIEGDWYILRVHI